MHFRNSVRKQQLPRNENYSDKHDCYFEKAAYFIVSSQLGPTSFLHRERKLGYEKVGCLID